MIRGSMWFRQNFFVNCPNLLFNHKHLQFVVLILLINWFLLFCFFQTHGYAWFPASLWPFCCLHLLDYIHRLLHCQLQIFMFYCDEHLSCFL